MKKLFAFVATALISVAMFASREVVPSDADLASYATGTYTMCIYNDGACNGIVLNGTYAGWPNAADHATLLDFVAGSGLFNWDYQLGPDAELIRGTADLLPGNNGTEVDIKNIGAGIVVIDVKSWKNNPCTAVYHTYKVSLVSPDCNDEDYITPAISGGFNGWAQEAMTLNELKTAERQNENLPGAVFEISFRAAEGSEYKFRSAAEWGADWSNELKEYDAENDEWKAFNGGANLVLGEETEITYDLGDPTIYSWNNCEKPQPEDSTVYVTVVYLKAPAGAPVEGVEIIGTFDNWAGTAMALENSGEYFAELNVMGFQEFKFRQAGSWDNEIVTAADGAGLANIRFDSLWEDVIYNDGPAKEIRIDLSSEDYVWKANWVEGIENVVPAKEIRIDLSSEDYVWKANWVEGIENVVLTEKAQKVVVDGVLYIVRDNKMFNVQGAQVR